MLQVSQYLLNMNVDLSKSFFSVFIDSLLSKITTEEASVIRARFQDKHSFKDIANELSKSIKTIRNTERSALKKNTECE
jgi:DNA-directed RNA polymerase sigma subunit (sigma70/sigma32)